jgi:hypothetical protein
MTRSKVQCQVQSVRVNLKRALDVLYAHATLLGLDLNSNLLVLTVPLIPNFRAVVSAKSIAILMDLPNAVQAPCYVEYVLLRGSKSPQPRRVTAMRIWRTWLERF